LDFEDNGDIESFRIQNKIIIKKSIQYLRGILAAGTKATAGNGWEKGMGMTVGTEYME
jgi:hypothetical protein